MGRTKVLTSVNGDVENKAGSWLGGEAESPKLSHVMGLLLPVRILENIVPSKGLRF